MLRTLIDDGRAVLRLEGRDHRDFLQDLVTNDLRRLAPGAPLYAALLSPQGKYLFDFILVAAEGGILLDLARDRAEALAERLALYRLRREVMITPTALRVVLAWGDGADSVPTADDGVIAVPDPRDPALGLRLYAADPEAALVFLPPSAPASRAEWDALRIAHGIPESGIELVPGESYILEAGFERLHGVDFRKGCYVGQEVTARMRHKATLRRGLVRVRVAGDPPPPGTPILAEGRPAGTLFSTMDGQGLALLRLDRSEGALRAGDAAIAILEGG
ncbi:MAG TPA: folate-binding protein [Paracoccaceae bacterium]|nr:folate-binding protein [Paracoccaceae bacterium]